MTGLHERFVAERSAGRFVVPQCTQCARTHWHPRSHCPSCGSTDIALVEPVWPAHVYTFTVNHRPRKGGGAGADDAPEAAMIGYVELDGGIRILANLEGVDAKSAIGTAVRPEPRRTEEDTVFVFVPASDS